MGAENQDMGQYLADLKKKSLESDRLAVSDNSADLQTRVGVKFDLDREEEAIQERALDNKLVDSTVAPMTELASSLLESIRANKSQSIGSVLETINELGPLATKDENGLEKLFLRIRAEQFDGQPKEEYLDWVTEVKVGGEDENSSMKVNGKLNVGGLENATKFLKVIDSGTADQDDNKLRGELTAKIGKKLNLEKGGVFKLLGVEDGGHLESLEILTASELNEMAKLEAAAARVQEA